jgi:hypothetical protein
LVLVFTAKPPSTGMELSVVSDHSNHLTLLDISNKCGKLNSRVKAMTGAGDSQTRGGDEPAGAR